MNQLDQLKKYSTVVIDTGNLDLIKQFNPQDATTNPSLVLNTIKSSCYKNLISNSINYAKKIGGTSEEIILNASNKISVDLGTEILKLIPGKVSTEIDSRFSFNKNLCIYEAKKIIKLYEENNINKNRVLIKLASTWESIQAAKELEKENINCNLTLLFSFAQARACAEAKVFLISPFVGRIYDWYLKNKLLKINSNYKDPGVKSVRKIFNFYKKNNYKTIIMAASFRNTEQILSLSGCDYLTISPILLSKLKSNNTIIDRKLFLPEINVSKKSKLTESEFRFQHNKDAMAVEKLSEGIRQFSYDQEKIENIIRKNM
ncbi:transaldolase [Buchnera aphidicola (Ceratoglyphina bambusae)]|uniref:transaldolase n=1 Tax=Buchnera aphidicola TaxID=9 RepID=UPI0031B89791